MKLDIDDIFGNYDIREIKRRGNDVVFDRRNNLYEYCYDTRDTIRDNIRMADYIMYNDHDLTIRFGVRFGNIVRNARLLIRDANSNFRKYTVYDAKKE